MEAAPRFELGIEVLQTPALPLGYAADKKWSGKRDSNPRPSPWQGDALPLSYFRPLLSGNTYNDTTRNTWVSRGLPRKTYLPCPFFFIGRNHWSLPTTFLLAW